MENLNILCFDKDDNLVMASTFSDIKEGQVVEFKNKDYVATDVRDGMYSITRFGCKIIDFQKYKK